MLSLSFFQTLRFQLRWYAFCTAVGLGLSLSSAVRGQAAIEMVQVTAAQPWQRLEFRIDGIPAVSNPFDPEIISIDADFLMPSGKTTTVPAFWRQNYQRSLSGANEMLAISGSPEWRLRFAPPELGTYSVNLTVRTNGQLHGTSAANFAVTGVLPPRSGYVRIDPDKRYFETGDGQALRLNGANYCWHGSRGTYDYEDWFASMQAAGMNFTRLWMWPTSFGLETDATSLNRYRMDRAWQLDYVLRLAEQKGIYIELCLDYHGMFAVEPDYWGGNNYWPKHPYNSVNGGPALNQTGFFTNSTAKAIYKKRLRYLTARYGYSPNLLAWQFFNEIDNVYSLMSPASVTAWHGEMGSWLRAHDPFGHLITTSFTYADKYPEMWSLPQMDYVCIHSYGPNRPASALSASTQSLRQKHGKPVLIDEFGTSWQGWNRTADPYLRGFRQGLWGGALGGSAGSAMSWWWEKIHSENVYPTYSALVTILSRTGWGRGSWTNITFAASLTPPQLVGELVPGGAPFAVTLPLSSGWGSMLSGQIAVPNQSAANFSAAALNSFVHGSSHNDLRIPFRLSAWFTNSAKLVMHINSVSWNSVLVVRADGAELFRTNLPNPDGYWSVTNEYNLDLPVNLPSGKKLVEIVNAGSDWLYLDWVRLEGVLPATYTNLWQPPCEPIGLGGPRESLIYVVAPGTAFPGNATNAVLSMQENQQITLTNWPVGQYFAEWYDPASGNRVGFTSATTTNQALHVPLPNFEVDLAGVMYATPRLTPPRRDPSGSFRFKLESETGGRYSIQTSTNLSHWVSFLSVTNLTGTADLMDPERAETGASFYRARQQP